MNSLTTKKNDVADIAISPKKRNVFEVLANRTTNKECKIASLKDFCEPVPFGTLDVYKADNGVITNSSGLEIGKVIQCELISWNYIYLISDENGIIAESFDGLCIEATGECLKSFCDSQTSKISIKNYTQFICIHDEQLVVISISPYGTKRFKQYLASMMMKGSLSSMIEVSAVNEKNSSKTFTFLDVKVLENVSE